MSKAQDMINWMKRTSAEVPEYEKYVDSLSNQIQSMAHEAAEDSNYDEANHLMDMAMKAMTEGFQATTRIKFALNQEDYDAAMNAWQEYKAKYEAI